MNHANHLRQVNKKNLNITMVSDMMIDDEHIIIIIQICFFIMFVNNLNVFSFLPLAVVAVVVAALRSASPRLSHTMLLLLPRDGGGDEEIKNK